MGRLIDLDKRENDRPNFRRARSWLAAKAYIVVDRGGFPLRDAEFGGSIPPLRPQSLFHQFEK